MAKRFRSLAVANVISGMAFLFAGWRFLRRGNELGAVLYAATAITFWIAAWGHHRAHSV